MRVENLESVAERVRHAGYDVQFDENLPGSRRFYIADPFGNRLEFLEVTS